MRIFCKNVLFLDQTIFTEMHERLSQFFWLRLREQNIHFVKFYLSYLAFVSQDKSDEELECLGVYDVLATLSGCNFIEYILLGTMTGYLLEDQAYQLVSSYEKSTDYDTHEYIQMLLQLVNGRFDYNRETTAKLGRLAI